MILLLAPRRCRVRLDNTNVGRHVPAIIGQGSGSRGWNHLGWDTHGPRQRLRGFNFPSSRKLSEKIHAETHPRVVSSKDGSESSRLLAAAAAVAAGGGPDEPPEAILLALSARSPPLKDPLPPELPTFMEPPRAAKPPPDGGVAAAAAALAAPADADLLMSGDASATTCL